jgi:hypothetical protein
MLATTETTDDCATQPPLLEVSLLTTRESPLAKVITRRIIIATAEIAMSKTPNFRRVTAFI